MEESTDVTLNTKLPNNWVLYLYDKQLAKKIVNRPNYQVSPNKKVCTISTVNDLIYLLQLMEAEAELEIKIEDRAMVHSSEPQAVTRKNNLDMNNYIIMREGIEPVWEDPKNSNGGTFSVKMAHSRGYEIWALFIMYMLGETLTYDMDTINGITVSYISDNNNYHNPLSTVNSNYTYVKIWDAKKDRTKEEFTSILPMDILDKIQNDPLASTAYSKNSIKKDFNEKNSSKFFSRPNSFGREKGGFYPAKNNNNRGRRYN